MYVYMWMICYSQGAQWQIEQLKNRLKVAFEIIDLGMLSYFLGMEFIYTDQGIILHQRKYIYEVLNRFNMNQCNGPRCLLLEI